MYQRIEKRAHICAGIGRAAAEKRKAAACFVKFIKYGTEQPEDRRKAFHCLKEMNP